MGSGGVEEERGRGFRNSGFGFRVWGLGFGVRVVWRKRKEEEAKEEKFFNYCKSDLERRAGRGHITQSPKAQHPRPKPRTATNHEPKPLQAARAEGGSGNLGTLEPGLSPPTPAHEPPPGALRLIQSNLI